MNSNLSNIKAVCLAGGKGERLGALTKNIPKPMVQIAGKPMLEYIVRHIQSHGLTDFIFKTHHLSHVVEKYFKSGEHIGVQIQYLVEPEPWGTAGGLRFLKDEKNPVLIAYGDVLFNIDLHKLIQFHRASAADATLVVFETEHPHDSDIVIMEGEKIARMIRKPGSSEFGNLAGAALYMIEPRCFAHIPEDGAYDLDVELLPLLIEKKYRVCGYKTNEYIEDAGTPERLQKVTNDIASGRVFYI